MSKIKSIKIFLIIPACIIYLGCGTLGNIGQGIYFPISKDKLDFAMDSLFAEYPQYKTPQKWKIYNDWSKRGYGFQESRIFYIEARPEEMYYVTFIGDSLTLTNPSRIGIGIQAVFNGSGKWILNSSLESKEIQRIEDRFNNEIIYQLERYTNTKAVKEVIY